MLPGYAESHELARGAPQVCSDPKCNALSVPCYKESGRRVKFDSCSPSFFFDGRFLPISPQGLPAMFLAGMKVLKATRLGGGKADAFMMFGHFGSMGLKERWG
jgi:hypothetical protein